MRRFNMPQNLHGRRRGEHIITFSSKDVYELILWLYPFYDLNPYGLKSNLEIRVRKEIV